MATKATANLIMRDTLGNSIVKNLPNVNPELVPAYGESIDVESKQTIIDACQALCGLTTNTFNSVTLTVTYDL